MLRHTTFAIVSLFACGVASAQQPLAPYFNYGGTGSYPAANCPNGFCGTQSGNCSTGNCATGNCATGSFGNTGMICGPNGCYAPGTAPGSVNPYQPRSPLPTGWSLPGSSWPYGTPSPNYRTMPAYSVPSSTYPGFPNVPSAYRNRNVPTAGGYPLYNAPVNGHYGYYPSLTGAANQFDNYGTSGVLH